MGYVTSGLPFYKLLSRLVFTRWKLTPRRMTMMVNGNESLKTAISRSMLSGTL